MSILSGVGRLALALCSLASVAAGQQVRTLDATQGLRRDPTIAAALAGVDPARIRFIDSMLVSCGRDSVAAAPGAGDYRTGASVLETFSERIEHLDHLRRRRVGGTRTQRRGPESRRAAAGLREWRMNAWSS